MWRNIQINGTDPFLDYRNRFYMPDTGGTPDLGRFLQTDPIDFEGDDKNLYRYVLNNPVNKVDPLGMVPYFFTYRGALDAALTLAFGNTLTDLVMYSKNREWCGQICKSRRNAAPCYTYSGPIRGTESFCFPAHARCPANTDSVASYHSHKLSVSPPELSGMDVSASEERAVYMRDVWGTHAAIQGKKRYYIPSFEKASEAPPGKP